MESFYKLLLQKNNSKEIYSKTNIFLKTQVIGSILETFRIGGVFNYIDLKEVAIITREANSVSDKELLSKTGFSFIDQVLGNKVKETGNPQRISLELLFDTAADKFASQNLPLFKLYSEKTNKFIVCGIYKINEKDLNGYFSRGFGAGKEFSDLTSKLNQQIGQPLIDKEEFKKALAEGNAKFDFDSLKETYVFIIFNRDLSPAFINFGKSKANLIKTISQDQNFALRIGYKGLYSADSVNSSFSPYESLDGLNINLELGI